MDRGLDWVCVAMIRNQIKWLETWWMACTSSVFAMAMAMLTCNQPTRGTVFVLNSHILCSLLFNCAPRGNGQLLIHSTTTGAIWISNNPNWERQLAQSVLLVYRSAPLWLKQTSGQWMEWPSSGWIIQCLGWLVWFKTHWLHWCRLVDSSIIYWFARDLGPQWLHNNYTIPTISAPNSKVRCAPMPAMQTLR